MSGERFAGFPNRMSYLPVPASFFGSLLREIDDLAEMKLTLHGWRLLQQQRRPPRFLRQSELEADRELLLSLRSSAKDDPVGAVGRALNAATERGTLLAVTVEVEGREERCYLLNTASNQGLAGQIRRGEASLGPFKPLGPVAPPPEPRQGIYELYEQNIGLLTPLIAEELREAELHYSEEWIEEAFREAVAYNKRNWRYVRRILENWATRGRGERGETRGYPQPPDDPSRYLEGRYGRLLKR
jgi:DNA replication protein